MSTSGAPAPSSPPDACAPSSSREKTPPAPVLQRETKATGKSRSGQRWPEDEPQRRGPPRVLRAPSSSSAASAPFKSSCLRAGGDSGAERRRQSRHRAPGALGGPGMLHAASLPVCTFSGCFTSWMEPSPSPCVQSLGPGAAPSPTGGPGQRLPRSCSKAAPITSDPAPAGGFATSRW